LVVQLVSIALLAYKPLQPRPLKPPLNSILNRLNMLLLIKQK
jgi:hypothetical protein